MVLRPRNTELEVRKLGSVTSAFPWNGCRISKMRCEMSALVLRLGEIPLEGRSGYQEERAVIPPASQDPQHHHGMYEKHPRSSLCPGEALSSPWCLSRGQAKEPWGPSSLFSRQVGIHIQHSSLLCHLSAKGSKPRANKLPDKRHAWLLCQILCCYGE